MKIRALFPANIYLGICNLSLPRSVTFLKIRFMRGLRVADSKLTIVDAMIREAI